MQQLAEILKSKNLKVTPQRLAIFNILYNTTEHPSAEKIYQALLETHPTMSLATVYKTLDAFKKTELVQELNTTGDSYRYDANIKSHPHAICVECDGVFDIHTHLLDDIKSKVQSETEFTILSQKIYFYGICPKCKNKIQYHQ